MSREPRQVRREPVVVTRDAAAKAPLSHRGSGSRHHQIGVLPCGSLARLRHTNQSVSQGLRFACSSHLVQQTQRVIPRELICAKPAQVLKQIRHVVKFPAAENHLGTIVNYFLNPRDVFLGTAAVHRDTVSDLREDEGLDQDGDN